MPRKLKRIPPQAQSAQQAAQIPEPIPTPQGEPPRKKTGRPSNAEVAAREQAARDALAMKPADTVYLTATCLRIVSFVVKGDEPTDEEIEAVNGPACAVMNKYPGSLKWAAEFSLVSALFAVTVNMRTRGKQKRKQATPGGDSEARGALDPGTQGLGEIASSPFVS